MALRRRTAPSYLETHQIHQLRLSSACFGEISSENIHHDNLTLDPTPTSNTKSSGKQSYLISSIQVIGLVFLCALPWAPSVILDRKVQAVQQEAISVQMDREKSIKGVVSALDRRRQLNERVLGLEMENNKLLNILKLHGDLIDPTNNIYKKAEKEEEILMERISGIESTIQTLDQQTLQQKYGYAPLIFDFRFGQSHDRRLTKQLEVATAFPIERIPHTMLTILDMTEKKSLEGTSLSYEAGGCLQLAVDPAAGTSPTTSLVFAEHPGIESIEGVKVLIGKRQAKSVLLFCPEDAETKANDMEIESHFGTLVSGGEALMTLISAPNGWEVRSIATRSPPQT